jgi:hypothetical protein
MCEKLGNIQKHLPKTPVPIRACAHAKAINHIWN